MKFRPTSMLTSWGSLSEAEGDYDPATGILWVDVSGPPKYHFTFGRRGIHLQTRTEIIPLEEEPKVVEAPRQQQGNSNQRRA